MINDETVFVNCLYLYNIFGVIGILVIKQKIGGEPIG